VDLRTAVAASMLPAGRSRLAAAVKDCSYRTTDGAGILPRVLDSLGIPADLHPSVIDAAVAAADAALSAGAAAGFEAIAAGDARYPALLACTADPPPVLWVGGDVTSLTCPAVAVVGSRAATSYAMDVGYRLAGELAGRGVVVASGLARGVDSAAHRGCLDAGGRTVAVLGSGLNRIYPAEHISLAATISEHGALVSELAPGAPALPEHFPLRNRIISGISLAVVVVEASEKSGSLITARWALEQGRDVMAVPGSILSGRNRGSHALLKDGAKVVETADDILDELGWPPGTPRGTPSQTMAAKMLNSDPLLSQMEAGELYGLDQLVGLSGLNASRLLTRLMELELSGKVAGVGGRWKVC
jgi:DNA processing protein